VVFIVLIYMTVDNFLSFFLSFFLSDIIIKVDKQNKK
jgi:hypothetical protein